MTAPKKAFKKVTKKPTGFYGVHECSMDEKGRVSIPAELRHSIPEDTAWFLVPMQEGAVGAGSLNVLFNIAGQDIEEGTIDYQRDAAPFCQERIAIDSQGRITFKKELRHHLGLEGKKVRKLILTGHFDHFEIRSEETWEKHRRKLMSRVKEHSPDLDLNLDSAT